jgi:hypothetical protein
MSKNSFSNPSPLIAPILLTFAALAAGSAPVAPAKDERTVAMDYGPFLSASVVRKAEKPVKGKKPATRPADPSGLGLDVVAFKAIAIKVGTMADGAPATVCFDTDLISMSAGWTGGFLDLSESMLTNHKGTANGLAIAGKEAFRHSGPGWAAGDDFTDPRPQPLGPLPRDRAGYKGLYLHGNDVVLSYRVGNTDVLELPAYDREAGAFTRTFHIVNSKQPLSLAVCDAPDRGVTLESGSVAWCAEGDEVTGVKLLAAPATARLEHKAGRIVVRLAPLPQPATFTVGVARCPQGGRAQLEARLGGLRAGRDPTSLCSGGPPRWNQTVTTAGQAGDNLPGVKSGAAYVVDTLTLPEKNPWESWMRLTGHDFMPDGRVAVCTLNGDVWTVSGIKDKLGDLTWRRFAAGLYQPLGLRVLDGKVYVLGRDQITRLHDLNDDGEADFYENFNNDGVVNPSYHGFALELQTDPAGNFYYARCGHRATEGYPGHGDLLKVSKDGSALTTVATGLRAPNGMGADPFGRISVADNQGNWVPSSKINLVDPNGPADFLGYVPQYRPGSPKPQSEYAKPMLWLPHKVDNSSGGQTYVDSDRWGPLKGKWVHTSFGTACVMLVLPDYPGGDPARLPKQAAALRLPLNFPTGVMRARFSPHDGQLYLSGVGGGWQTSGPKDGGLYRVRYTGKPVHLPMGFAVVPGGVRLTFASPLDRKISTDPDSWGGEQWNYLWTDKYGSPDYSAKNAGKAGRDEVEIKSVAVSEDGRTVTLSIPGLQPVMQMALEYNLEAADGAEVEQELYLTINEVPKR